MRNKLLKFILKFNSIYLLRTLLNIYYKKDIIIWFETYISLIEDAINKKHILIADELYNYYNLTSNLYNDNLYFYIIVNDQINMLKYFENKLPYKYNDVFVYYMLIYDSINVLTYLLKNNTMEMRNIEMYLFDKYFIIKKSNLKPKCLLFLIDEYNLNIDKINKQQLREYLYKIKNENKK